MQKPHDSQISHLSGSEVEKISIHISLRYVYEENDRWNLHIIVDEMTTAAELRESWGKIDKAKEDLKLWQGTDPNWYSIALLLDLEERKKESSHSKLAMDMNFDTLVYLLWAMDESKGKNNSRAGQITFINHLQGLGIKLGSVKELEEQGRIDLGDGKLPWTPKIGPIKARRIIDALIQFEKEKKNKKIVITPTTSTNYLTNIRIQALISKYWLQARDILKERNPGEFKLYEDRWNARTNELLIKNSELLGLNSQ